MAFSVFADPSRPPDREALRRALGSSECLWLELLDAAHSAAATLSEHWHHSSARSGWSLRVMQSDRVILYVTPHSSCFSVGIVLGERAVEEALSAALPPAAREALESAPRYAEGRGIRIVVSSPSQLEAVLALIPHKLAKRSREDSRPSRRSRRRR